VIITTCGLFAGAFVRESLTVSADATATAKNILAHESPFRLPAFLLLNGDPEGFEPGFEPSVAGLAFESR
jgi:hypothetical protein